MLAIETHIPQRLAKAQRMLTQAASVSPKLAPEVVIHMAYFAMRHAAAALLIERTGGAPFAQRAMIDRFAQVTADDGPTVRSLSEGFDWAEKVRLTFDEQFGCADPQDAPKALRIASDFLDYCRAQV